MYRMLIGAVAAILLTAPAAAQEQRPEAFKKLVDCRAIAGAAERLACFDREVAAIEAAESRKELVIVDNNQIRQTKRSLFGLTLPNLAIFGDGAEEEEDKEIISTIDSAWMVGHDKWGFKLADGARWVQTDSRNLNVDPKPGDPIRIRRAAMGSFLANVKGATAIRVKRVN